MRHYVLTRSAYGPAWDLASNRRRLSVTRAVTARLMALQSATDWTWVVLLDECDPLRDERLALYRASAPNVIPLWRSEHPEATDLSIARQRLAAADYRVPWRSTVGPADDRILMTRLDDDDGFPPDALARYQKAARPLKRRTALMFELGVRVWANRYRLVRHRQNAMHTLVTPPGDELCVYDYGHTKVRQQIHTIRVDGNIGWLWVRHRDTISGYHEASRPIPDFIRKTFPVDWPALEAAWKA